MQTFGLGVAGWILFSLGTTCAMLSNFILVQEIGEVNRKLPDDEQISYWFWWPGKAFHLFAEYKRLYPNGRLEFWRITLEIAAIIFAVALVLTIFPPFKHLWKSILHGGTLFPAAHWVAKRVPY
jgi:hypothetical protein